MGLVKSGDLNQYLEDYRRRKTIYDLVTVQRIFT